VRHDVAAHACKPRSHDLPPPEERRRILFKRTVCHPVGKKKTKIFQKIFTVHSPPETSFPAPVRRGRTPRCNRHEHAPRTPGAPRITSPKCNCAAGESRTAELWW